MVPIKFERSLRHKRRPATNRRLAAARQWIGKQIEKAGLFAAQVAEELPTPEERIEGAEDRHEEFWQNMRNSRAQTWIRARKALRELPDADRCVIAWNNSGLPKDGSSFAVHVRRWPERREYLERPLSENERRILVRLQEAFPAAVEGPAMTDKDRLACFELTERGLIEKHWRGNVITWCALAPVQELAATTAD